MISEQRMWGCIWRKYAKKDCILGVFSRKECWQPLGERIQLLLGYFGLQTAMFRMCSAQTVMGAAPPPWQLTYGFALLLIITQQKKKWVKRKLSLHTQTMKAHGCILQGWKQKLLIAILYIFTSHLVEKIVHTVFTDSPFLLLNYIELRDAVQY